MPNTYTLIESITVGSGGTASVTLGSGGTIPQIYTDLRILMSARLAGNGDSFGNYLISFNGAPGGSSYAVKWALAGAGTSSSGGGTQTPDSIRSNYSVAGSAATASIFSVNDIYIPNYRSTSDRKIVCSDNVGENNHTTEARLTLIWGEWNPSTQQAITSIVLTSNYTASELFAQHSTFYLYGIKKD